MNLAAKVSMTTFWFQTYQHFMLGMSLREANLHFPGYKSDAVGSRHLVISHKVSSVCQGAVGIWKKLEALPSGRE